MQNIIWEEWKSKRSNFDKYSHVKAKLIYGNSIQEQTNISIVIPTYKRANLLEEALQSAINQKTNTAYSVIVVDNASEIDKNTDKLMREYCNRYTNVSYYRNSNNIGMFGNWNRCIEVANSKWLCILHDDDILYPNYIEVVSKYTNNENMGIFGVYNEKYDQRDNDQRLSVTGKSSLMSKLINMFIKARQGKPIPLTFKDAIEGRYIMPCATLLNKRKVHEIGGFDESYFPIADIVLYTKMSFYYNVAFIPLYLAKYRIAVNESLNMDTKRKFPIFTYKFTEQLCKELGYNSIKIRKKSLHNAISSGGLSIISQDMKDDSVIKTLEINRRIYTSFSNKIIQVVYHLKWAAMLFRRYK